MIIFQENPLTFDWSIILLKSDIREPLNPNFLVQKKKSVNQVSQITPHMSDFI